MKVESAFSGLEACIVLIAFVVVASVFSYTVLGAGFFATSKATGITYSGIKQTTANVVMDGYFYGSCDQAGKLIGLTFYIKVPSGSNGVVLDQMKYVYAGDNHVGQIVTPIQGGKGTLPTGERTKVVIGGLGGPAGGSTFSLEIKPPVGSSSLMQRKLTNGFSGGVIY